MTRLPGLGVAFILGAVVNFSVSHCAKAHDAAWWIQMQRLRNAVGEWCCGSNDCDSVSTENFSDSAAGYVLRPSGETIPYSEVSPISPDGNLWICRRPDKTRRCVFGPPAGS